MKQKDYEKFYAWYKQQKDVRFSFQEELVKYCRQDVALLRMGCMKFRQLFLDSFDIDPFRVKATIPGVCMYLYQLLYMPEGKIAIVPHEGYRKNDRQSVIAIKWMKWISETENLSIQHARNGGEVHIGNLKVDGHDRNNPKLVYEFYGCVSVL